jgi:hypothetical protein
MSDLNHANHRQIHPPDDNENINDNITEINADTKVSESIFLTPPEDRGVILVIFLFFLY